MFGVVLSGGQSTRMGTDKGLLKFYAGTWVQTAVDKLDELQLPVIISVNQSQLNDYSAIFPSLQIVVDNDQLQLKGPLCGVLSVHMRYPAEDLLLLACDMPLMETLILKELLNLYNQQPNNDAFVFNNDGEPEPLCGIYKASGLAHILRLYQTDRLSRHSMKYMLEHINTHCPVLPADKKKAFRNFNTHAELNGL